MNVTDRNLRVLGRFIGEHYGASRVVLFGSRAEGTAHEDSDVDLLIIKETDDPFLARSLAVRKIASGLLKGVPLQPLVFTSNEIKERLRAGDQFIAGILEKGAELYAA